MAETTEESRLVGAKWFNKSVEEWTHKIRRLSVSILDNTDSTGRLQRELNARLLRDHEGGEAYVGLGFRFWKYGAYREYGAGRGYIVKDGVIMRGHSAWANTKKRIMLRAQKVSEYRIRRMRTVDNHYGTILRTPLPWLDPPIVQNIDELADISAEYYGDTALKKVIEKFNVITIEKRYGKK